MLHVWIIDSSAEERLATLQWIRTNIESESEGMEYFPRLALNPISLSELKFQKTPDLVIIGPALASGPADDLTHVRKVVPDVPIIVVAPASRLSVTTVEYLARAGIEDIICQDTSAAELLRRFVIVASRVRRKSNGNLIVVEAAKGGVGATSIASALAEQLAEAGKRTLLVDSDDERQSLCRFLVSRPYVNEPLQALLNGAHPVSSDFVQECTTQVWSDLPSLWCMAPPREGALAGIQSTQVSRTLISIFEALDQLFDYVIVDSGRASGTFRRILHRAADKVIFVTDGDPASAFAAFEKIKRIRQEIAPDTSLMLVENRRSSLRGLSHSHLVSEFERLAGVDKTEWASAVIPFCARLAHWPGSGMSAYMASGRSSRRALSLLAREAGLVEQAAESRKSRLAAMFSARINAIRTWCREITSRSNSRELLQSPEQKISLEPRAEIDWSGSRGHFEPEAMISPPQPV